MRFHCPIYTVEKIMSAAGIIVDDKKEETARKKTETKKPPSKIYEQQSLEELNSLLKKAVEKEDYEKAGKIRDEINRRKKKK